MEVLMMKNIMVLLTVAVLGGSQAVSMNKELQKELKQVQMMRRGQDLLKNDSSIVSGVLGKKNAENNINKIVPIINDLNKNFSNAAKLLGIKYKKQRNNKFVSLEIIHDNAKHIKSVINPVQSNAIVAQTVVIKDKAVVKKQGFFRSLYNKVVQNKGKVAAGVVGMTLLAGAAYYMLSNQVSAINVVAQPVCSALKSCYEQDLFLGAMIPSRVCHYAAQFNSNFQNIIL